MQTLWQDLRYALRILTTSPGFTVVAVLTLALGIGANSAIFSVIDNVLLHPVPWKDPDRILSIWETNAKNGMERQTVSPANFLDWETQSHPASFDYVAAWRFVYQNLTGLGQPEEVEALAVTADYFPLLGYRAALGRTFLPGEDQLGHGHTVILSHDFWQRRFSSDPTLIGRTLEIEGEPYTVIGILPADFHIFRVLNREIDLFVPLILDPSRLSRDENSVMVYARLTQRASLTQAQSEMDAAYHQLAQEYPATNSNLGVHLVSLPQQWVIGLPTQPGPRQVLLLLSVAVGLVLLIACSNVANLLLARGAARQRELAIRIALGAGRFRLIQQLQTESLLLALGGGALGLLLAHWIIGLLNVLIPYTALNRTEDFRLSASVLGFTLAISFLTSVLFGLAPALRFSRVSLTRPLSEAGRSLSVGIRGRRLYDLQVVAEIALAVMLLVAGTLVLRSFLHLEAMNRGLDVKNVATMQIRLPRERYAEGRAVGQFYQKVLQGIRVLPGVESASVANFPPLAVQSTGVAFTTDGRGLAVPEDPPFAKVSVVSPNYFKTMRIPFVAGRDFTEGDANETHGVVIISAAMARRFWPGQTPIGKQVWPEFSRMQTFWAIESNNVPLAIVGVVGDIGEEGTLDISLPQMYVPYLQNPSTTMNLLIRTARNPLDWTSAVQSQVWSVDKDQPVSNIRTMQDVVAQTFSQPSMIAWLLDSFAVLALILASVGTYGVISYSVGQRTHEMGIRIALGARPRDVLRLVIGESLGPVSAGTAAGLLGALVAARVLASLLYGISPSDPITFAGVAVSLMTVALLACYIPARRATRVDPMVALRHE